MRSAGALILLSLALLAAAPSASASRYRVGIGEQDPTMFADPAFQSLGIKRARYITAWDWRRNPVELNAFIGAARLSGVRPLIHFSSSASCYDGKRYSKIKRCRLPSPKAYAASIRAFRKAYPFIRDFGAWNEANHKSQATYRAPKRAAQYYNALRKACRTCTIVAADLLDDTNILPYTRRFRRFAKGNPKLWGLHNYYDVNRRRTSGTQRFLRTVPGEVWLTETGGIVNLTGAYRYSLTRAKARLGFMFSLADRFSRKRRGQRSRITRIYPYAWKGEARGARFDAGLVGPDGAPRPGYGLFRAKLKSRSR